MKKTFYNKIGKRLIDIIVSLAALPVFIIAFLIFAPIIYLTDRGPVFYNAQRLGVGGKPFKMYKFRSMKVNAPDIRNEDGSTYNGADDPRVTKIGRFMRNNSIDEIPQFLNVLIGNMSIIGPRPDPLSDMEIYTEEQKTKLKVKPGITGYNQAYYRNSVTQDEKFEHDVQYANKISFVLDIKIFFKTIAIVLGHENIYNDASEPVKEEKAIIEAYKE